MKRHKKPVERKYPALATISVVAAVILALATLLTVTRRKSEPHRIQYPKGELTFARHIAPIIHQHCSTCHRPGQAAPFPLLTYEDVRKRAPDVRKVVEGGFMPPWPPESGHGHFLGERRLPREKIGMITQWISEGSPEGARADPPPLPQWSADWELGPPDIVVNMPEPYTLAADGRDVYRNFVVPVPLQTPRYVRAIQFRPGNPKVVHHTLIKLDSTGEARRRAAADAEIGFAGMVIPGETGHFLGWQPGRGPCLSPAGMPWQIRPGSDLVLQMHLSPSGKPELVQPSIAFYFTDQPPEKTPFRILLTSVKMDIPAAENAFAVEDSYVLPVPVDVTAILPHAHYLGKEIRAWATLPDGRNEPLILIRNWDFNWQSDYQYARPISLPEGTKLSMRFTYDNSTNNVRNPSFPPRRVLYGPESSDEMAELWLQVVPRNTQDLERLRADYEVKSKKRFFDGNVFLANRNPPDAEAVATVGTILLMNGDIVEAERYLTRAVALNETDPRSYYGLGLLRRRQQRLPEARDAFERAIGLDPADGRSHSNLGYVYLGLGDVDAAARHFTRALDLDPRDPLAQQGINDLSKFR